MSNAVFPSAVRGLTFAVSRSFEIPSIVQSAPNGASTRIAQTFNPIWHWILLYEFLKDNASDILPGLNDTDFRSMMGFLLARGGPVR